MTFLGVVLSGTLAAAICFLVIRGLHPVAHRLGLIDHPVERRKLHRHAVPLIGGVALFSGVLTATLLATQVTGLLSGPPLDGLGAGLTGAVLLVIVGVLDDRFGLGFRVRLLAQLIAVLILALGGGVQLHVLGDLFGAGPIQLGLFSIPFTLFAAVGIINAFNMIDGIDGLAAGLFLVAVVALLFSNPPETALFSFLLPVVAIALLPFLACNLSLPGCTRQKVFLGDAGSMLLGYIVAWALIDASQSASSIAPVTALWFVAIPLLDKFNVMGRRLRSGRSPFKADRGQLHHVLTRSTGSPRAALLTILTLALALTVPAVAGVSLELAEPGYFYLALVTLALYVVLQTRAPQLHRYLRRKRRRLPTPDIAGEVRTTG